MKRNLTNYKRSDFAKSDVKRSNYTKGTFSIFSTNCKTTKTNMYFYRDHGSANTNEDPAGSIFQFQAGRKWKLKVAISPRCTSPDRCLIEMRPPFILQVLLLVSVKSVVLNLQHLHVRPVHLS